MSDRYLRQLLRDVKSGDIPLTDYIAAALRVMSLEDVLVTLQGFDTNDVRQAVKIVWIPAYAAQSKENRDRVALADVLASNVVPGEDNFPEYSFYRRHKGLLSDREWRLFAADCAEHVLHIWESVYPNDNRPRQAIETARRLANGLATQEELDYVKLSSESAANTALGTSASWFAAWAAFWTGGPTVENFSQATAKSARSALQAVSQVGCAARQTEITWQRNRLIDYLTGLSALPPSEI